MKCPACGFETPDAQAWCDFCKEPFRRAKGEPPPGAPPPKPAAPVPQAKGPPAGPDPRVPLPLPGAASPRPAAAVPPAKASAAPAQGAAGVAPRLTPEQAFEMMRLDPGERIAPVSPTLRYAAYAFLLVCLLWAAAMTMMMMNRAQRLQTEAPPASEDASAPAPVDDASSAPPADSAMTRG